MMDAKSFFMLVRESRVRKRVEEINKALGLKQ